MTDVDALVLLGLAAYARGEHFEAHERFEEAWVRSGVTAGRSLELHALAQLAAAVHKQLVHHKPDAALAIVRRVQDKLARVGASSFGLTLDVTRVAVASWIDHGFDRPPDLELARGDHVP